MNLIIKYNCQCSNLRNPKKIGFFSSYNYPLVTDVMTSEIICSYNFSFLKIFYFKVAVIKMGEAGFKQLHFRILKYF